jgi:hypothetical protein
LEHQAGEGEECDFNEVGGRGVNVDHSQPDVLTQFRELLKRISVDHRPERYRGTVEDFEKTRIHLSREIMTKMFSGESAETIERWHKEFMKPEHVMAREKAASGFKPKQPEPGRLTYLLGAIGEARRFAHIEEEFAVLERTFIDEVIDRIEDLDADFFETIARLMREIKGHRSCFDGAGLDYEWETIQTEKTLPQESSWLKQAGPEAGAVMFFFSFGREFKRFATKQELDSFLRETYDLTGEDSTRRIRKSVGLSGIPKAR